jgi:Tol biopolymer transport system component
VDFSGDDTCVAAVHDDARGNAGLYAMQLQACPWIEWTADRSRIAFTALTLDNRNQLVVVEGETPAARVVFDSAASSITTFAWAGDRLLVAGVFNGRSGIRWLALEGTLSPIADVAAPAYFYPSPDRSRFLFTQAAPDGWQLWMLDVATDAVTNLGNMGSDPASVAPPAESSPDNSGKSGPMYIAWSPDGTKVAFGGGFDPPYIMTTVELATGATSVTHFPNGYPGEIRWSADSAKIAVSTYDIERTHHETWVVDPATGEGRHLMYGCIIVWSPDGRFLAVHGEDVAGISIVDVDTAERAQITHRSDDAPVEWVW